MSLLLLKADAREIPCADESVDCIMTSPPYWSLRDYGVPPSIWGGFPSCAHQWQETEKREGYSDKRRWQHSENGRAECNRSEDKLFRDPVTRAIQPGAWTQMAAGSFCSLCGAWLGCLGLEPTPDLYVEHIVEIFREVRRVLKPNGTLWGNWGDSYNAAGRHGHGTRTGYKQETNRGSENHKDGQRPTSPDLKPKDLCGIPWRVAFALQADGWWLRSDIIWSKPNAMPESVRDRPTRAHEYIFLLSKAERYYYDAEAIRMPPKDVSIARRERGRNSGYAPPGQKAHSGASMIKKDKQRGHSRRHEGFNDRWDQMSREDQMALGSNIRTVWTIATQRYPDSHFATFPEDLVKPCILAGCPLGGIVLDPFGGSGTVGKVAIELGRRAILCDLGYHEQAKRRTSEITPGLPLETEAPSSGATRP